MGAFAVGNGAQSPREYVDVISIFSIAAEYQENYRLSCLAAFLFFFFLVSPPPCFQLGWGICNSARDSYDPLSHGMLSCRSWGHNLICTITTQAYQERRLILGTSSRQASLTGIISICLYAKDTFSLLVSHCNRTKTFDNKSKVPVHGVSMVIQLSTNI